MDSLAWQQDADGLHVMASDGNGGQCRFTIDNSLINYLLAGTPRIYHVFLRMNGNDNDECYVLDLGCLRPVIQKTNALKLSLGKKSAPRNVASGVPVGRYCLARGESYHDRFLSVSGWQSQRLYQDVYADAAGISAPPPMADVPVQPQSQPQHQPQYQEPEPQPQYQQAEASANTANPPAAQQADDFDLDLTL